MKTTDFTGQDFLTYVPVAAVPGSEVVLYNILDKYSGPLVEDWASGRSEKQQEPNHMLSVECSSCVSLDACLDGKSRCGLQNPE